LIKVSKLDMTARTGVRRLALERPDWLRVLEAAVAVAASVEDAGGEFAGAWVVDELRRRGERGSVPNLRLLVTYGLLEKSGASTRAGRRAYYRMPDRASIEDELAAWRARASTVRKQPRFIASGASTEPPADLARKVGELVFEPRSWR
jgi:hypothetical protein